MNTSNLGPFQQHNLLKESCVLFSEQQMGQCAKMSNYVTHFIMIVYKYFLNQENLFKRIVFSYGQKIEVLIQSSQVYYAWFVILFL